jgi:hypothetical protein
MGKARSTEPPNETPFQRFERLAREVVAVPKREIDKRQKAYLRKRQRNKS